MAVRTPTTATSPSARSGPTIAPRLSIARSNPYARPNALSGTTSAISALRAGLRSPLVIQLPARRTPTCHAAVVTPMRALRTAVAV